MFRYRPIVIHATRTMTHVSHIEDSHSVTTHRRHARPAAYISVTTAAIVVTWANCGKCWTYGVYAAKLPIRSMAKVVTAGQTDDSKLC